MTFEEWKAKLAGELARFFSTDGSVGDGEEYIRQTGDECWRKMFNNGLTPAEAAYEEASAAVDSL